MTDDAPLPFTPYDDALPFTPYDGGTSSGHSGSDTSEARSLREDRSGVTARRQRETLEYTAATGTRGITFKELCDISGWHHGQASGALSLLHKAKLIARLSEVRDRCKVYVTPENVCNRDIEPHGRNASVAETLAKVACEEEYAELVRLVTDYLDIIWGDDTLWPYDLADFINYRRNDE